MDESFDVKIETTIQNSQVQWDSYFTKWQSIAEDEAELPEDELKDDDENYILVLSPEAQRPCKRKRQSDKPLCRKLKTSQSVSDMKLATKLKNTKGKKGHKSRQSGRKTLTVLKKQEKSNLNSTNMGFPDLQNIIRVLAEKCQSMGSAIPILNIFQGMSVNFSHKINESSCLQINVNNCFTTTPVGIKKLDNHTLRSPSCEFPSIFNLSYQHMTPKLVSRDMPRVSLTCSTSSMLKGSPRNILNQDQKHWNDLQHVPSIRASNYKSPMLAQPPGSIMTPRHVLQKQIPGSHFTNDKDGHSSSGSCMSTVNITPNTSNSFMRNCFSDGFPDYNKVPKYRIISSDDDSDNDIKENKHKKQRLDLTSMCTPKRSGNRFFLPRH